MGDEDYRASRMPTGGLRIVVKNGLPDGKGAEQVSAEMNNEVIDSVIGHCIAKWNLEPDTSLYALRLDRSSTIATKDNILNGQIYVLIYSYRKKIIDLLANLETHGNEGIKDIAPSLENSDQEYLNLLVDEFNGIPVILQRLEYDFFLH